jgi:nucleoside-diphosphate-sugar epimerase
MSTVVFIGFGFSARAIARRLAASGGWSMSGTTTGAAGLARMTANGVEGLVFDGSAPSTELSRRIARATHVVVSAGPDTGGDPTLRHHHNDLASAPSLGWIGYLSTIGVYGDRKGAWVDETAAPAPTSDRSRRRVEAETAWLHLASGSGKRVALFRLAGIYGPGRSAVDQLLAGTARRIIKPGQVFNRIHVDDIALAVTAGMSGKGRFNAYNVSDDEPSPPQDVVAFAAGLLGLPVPPDIAFESANLSDMGRSFYSESKRVSNARIKADLGLTLQYPTYREGMAQIVAATRKRGT